MRCLLLIGFTALITASAIPSLLHATIDELRDGLDNNRFSSVQLTRAYLKRMDEVNDQLKVVIAKNPDALLIAEERDAERRRAQANNTTLPLLHGIPVTLKDNIGTKDKMDTTAGSFALVGAELASDSTVVTNLRRNGAIILAKVNLSQWAAWRGTSSKGNGWSTVGGQCVGAFGGDPGGSSSGSGVAAALGLGWASLGTDTAGSIIQPAVQNNVVGLRPTVGLTSRYLVVPISERHDAIGPLARTVKDAAALLAAVAGRDAHDNYTAMIPNEGRVPDYVAACKDADLEGVRVGVYRPDTTEDHNAALRVLEDQGATIVDNVEMPGVTNISDVVDLLNADFVANIAAYLQGLTTNPNNLTNLAELRAWTMSDSRENSEGTWLWDQALRLPFSNTSPEFYAARQRQLQRVGPEGILGALDRYKLDVIVGSWAVLNTPASTLGAPHLAVPMKTSGSSPNTLAITGALFSEEKLIRVACAYEQATWAQRDQIPTLVPKTELEDVIT